MTIIFIFLFWGVKNGNNWDQKSWFLRSHLVFFIETLWLSTVKPYLEIIPHDERQLPEARKWLGGAGGNHAVMEYFIVQGVWVRRGLVLRNTMSHNLLTFIEIDFILPPYHSHGLTIKINETLRKMICL